MQCVTGCVALNIPSERFQDPTDHGGLLGSWDSSGHSHANGIDHAAASMDSGMQCIGGGSLDVDPFDTSEGEYAVKPEPPKVPWPRFHPVPTQPVFGN